MKMKRRERRGEGRKRLHPKKKKKKQKEEKRGEKGDEGEEEKWKERKQRWKKRDMVVRIKEERKK